MVTLRNRYQLLDYAEKKGMPSIYDLLSKLQPTKDNLAHTDGKTIYINESQFDTLDYQDQFFIVSHEALHIIYKHADVNIYSHSKFPDRELLNICQDVCVNEYLQKRLKHRPTFGLFLDNVSSFLRMHGYIKGELQYQGQLTTKSLYEYLQNNVDQNMLEKLVEELQVPGMSDDEGGESTLQESTIKEIVQVFKIDANTMAKELPLSQNELQDLLEQDAEDGTLFGLSTELFNSGADKSTTCSKSREVPDDVKVLSKTEIINFVKQFVGNNAVIKGRSQTYTRPNRRIQSSAYVLKGTKRTKTLKEISIYLDTSGSMSQIFVDDMYNTLKKLYKTTKFKLFTFDNCVYSVDMSKNTSPYTSGGTDIKGVLRHIKTTNSDVTIMITDCEDNFTLKDVTSDLLIFTNNKSVVNRNPKVKLAYWE